MVNTIAIVIIIFTAIVIVNANVIAIITLVVIYYLFTKTSGKIHKKVRVTSQIAPFATIPQLIIHGKFLDKYL